MSWRPFTEAELAAAETDAQWLAMRAEQLEAERRAAEPVRYEPIVDHGEDDELKALLAAYYEETWAMARAQRTSDQSLTTATFGATDAALPPLILPTG